jgi:serine/threonine protein kinase/DNA-binding SARP family transcriptional activator/alpha-beta hydrolase superfamily lysophospholipase
MMTNLRLYFFGAPHCEADGAALAVDRKKTLALLTYLAVTDRPHQRDHLAALLWPELSQSAARANLRREISRLGIVVGKENLQSQGEALSLHPDLQPWIDVSVFRKRTAAAHAHEREQPEHATTGSCPTCLQMLEEAAGLYHGDFLESFNLPDCASFSEWQFFEAESLRQELADLLQKLAGWRANRGEYDLAIEHARRWLSLDPLHEPAHRQLMRLYALTGKPSAASRQYQECRRLLAEELGVEPDAETEELYRSIQTRQKILPQDEHPDLALSDPRRYIEEEQIATGGYGEVYRARDQVTGQVVVMKRIRRELAEKDQKFLARFEREGQALRQLKHPNIVALLAVVRQKGQPCLVMEYVPGGTLRDLLNKEKSLPLDRILSIALELADALSRAHHLGIIHRDLKPENILIAQDGTPRLTDFGVALLQHEDVRLTQTAALLGSPAYLSPEAVKGDEVDAHSDIWSFGVLLYEVLARQLPFSSHNLTSLMLEIINQPVPNILTLRPDLPHRLALLLDQMLVKNPSGRIGSMRQVAASLEEIRAQLALSGLTPEITQETPEPTQKGQEIHFCTAPDGVRIAYACSGTGPVLVKAANWLSHLEYDWDSLVWRHWIQGLSRYHRLIRYDERGCGLSDWQVEDLSFEARVADLETVVEASKQERFFLLGISQGGPIAMAYTLRHPERVSKLVLYGTYARGRLRRNPTAQQMAERELTKQLIRVGWGQENHSFRQVFAAQFLPEGTAEQTRAFTDLQRMTASPENAARIVGGFDHIDIQDLAAQLRVPTLVLHARGDMRIPFEEGRRVASLIPNARFVPLESKNHILLENEPAWWKFLETVNTFLAETE